MITILTPMGGRSLYEISGEHSYPKILNEVNKRSLFEYSQEPFRTMKEETRRLFLIPEDKNNELGLSAIVGHATSGQGEVILLKSETKGALCSCLLAIDHFDASDEIIIASADHFIQDDAQEIVDTFRIMQADAGVLTFQSLHPKWSYVKKNDAGQIIESAEKKAISREAIAGFFYFKNSKDFIDAAKDVIKKGCDINGEFYISSCLNEMILHGKSVVSRPLAEHEYYNFYDNHAIRLFSDQFRTNDYLKRLARRYIDYLALEDVSEMGKLCIDGVLMRVANKSVSGKNNLRLLFQEDVTYVDLKNICANGYTTFVEYFVKTGGGPIKTVDVITWGQGNRITSVHRYTE